MFGFRGVKGDLLSIFYTNPGREFYMHELGRMLGKKPGFFQSALYNLEQEGLLKSVYRANSRYFQANKDYPLFNEIKEIIRKTCGVFGSLKSALNGLNGIELAFVYGSFAKNTDNITSDIDLFIVGDADDMAVTKMMDHMEKVLKREINYRMMSIKELSSAIREKDPFIVSVLSGKKEFIIGGENEFGRIFKTKPGKKSPS